jgi:hypothetical protein
VLYENELNAKIEWDKHGVSTESMYALELDTYQTGGEVWANGSRAVIVAFGKGRIGVQFVGANNWQTYFYHPNNLMPYGKSSNPCTEIPLHKFKVGDRVVTGRIFEKQLKGRVVDIINDDEIGIHWDGHDHPTWANVKYIEHEPKSTVDFSAFEHRLAASLVPSPVYKTLVIKIPTHADYTLNDGICFYKGKILDPKDEMAVAIAVLHFTTVNKTAEAGAWIDLYKGQFGKVEFRS